MDITAVRRRFIPAGAGNTGRRVTGSLGVPVYPRWRGEHGRMTHPSNSGSGLSPLARGTHLGGNQNDEVNGLSPLARGTHVLPGTKSTGSRFIPAGAGNTPTVAVTGGVPAVYPRWRGEHGLVSGAFDCADGLSPLARGTHFQILFRPGNVRFIPAGAGNTGDGHFLHV